MEVCCVNICIFEVASSEIFLGFGAAPSKPCETENLGLEE